MINTIRQ